MSRMLEKSRTCGRRSDFFGIEVVRFYARIAKKILDASSGFDD